MDVFPFIVAGSYSIGIAAIIAVVRIRKIHKSYRPFLLFLFASLTNEISSNLLIQYGKSNAVGNNIFGFTEALIWVWQFKEWKAIDLRRWYQALIVTGILLIWITENIILGKLFSFSSVYAVVYSSAMVLISINVIIRQIVEESRNLFLNARFLICSGMLIFSAYRILVESFYLLEIEGSNVFLGNVFLILVFVNLFVNLLLAIATLWIPTRQKFTLR